MFVGLPGLAIDEPHVRRDEHTARVDPRSGTAAPTAPPAITARSVGGPWLLLIAIGYWATRR